MEFERAEWREHSAMTFRVASEKGISCIQLPQVRGYWRAYVDMLMEFQSLRDALNPLTS
jgi:hypothetical protein